MAGARDLLPHMHRIARFAMQECCYAFLVNSICGPFSKGQQNPEGRRGAGWQALANGAANIISCGPAL